MQRLSASESDFRNWATARRGGLRRTAYLICLDWYLADDLVQEALTKVYTRWRRLARIGEPDAYARRVLVTSCIDARRRPWRREISSADPAGLSPLVDRSAQEALTRLEHDDPRTPVALALAALTPGQRATVVLRFYEDVSVEQTATLLGCSAGTVKSQTSKGLAQLRNLLGEPSVPEAGSDSAPQKEDVR